MRTPKKTLKTWLRNLSDNMKIGLFFGTFNPIHIGHLVIANYCVEYTDLDEVWFVITPMSPFKQKKSMLSNVHRLSLANTAVENYPKLKTSDIEFKLKQPNYTVDTLVHFEEKYPNHNFNLIMGEDNLKSFHKWKNYEIILENYSLYVYPRVSSELYENELTKHENVKVVDAPIMQISSTQIRKAIKEGKNCEPMLPAAVWKYIDEMNFYKS